MNVEQGDPDGGPLPHLWPQSLIAERTAGAGPPLARCALELCTRVPEVLGTAPFRWDLMKSPAQEIVLTLAEMEARVSPLRSEPFALGDHAEAWTTMLSVEVNPHERRERASLSLPGPREPQLLELDGMMRLVETCASTLGANVAFTSDGALGHALHGRRAFERSRAALPKAVRALLREQPYLPVPGLAGELPELYLPVEIDAEHVPAAVQWVNWWSRPIVETLGRASVESAGWARVASHADGSLTLVATEAPPDLCAIRDVEQIASLIAALDLVAVQARFPAPR